VGMGFFDQAAVRGLHRLEVGIAFELERVEGAHLVARTGAVARPRPFPLRGLAASGIPKFFLGRPSSGLLGAEAREIVPVPVVLGRMGLAKIPALTAVRRFWRGTIAGVGAALAVAQAHLRRRAALVAVRAPAGKAPVVRSLLLRHSVSLTISKRHCDPGPDSGEAIHIGSPRRFCASR